MVDRFEPRGGPQTDRHDIPRTRLETFVGKDWVPTFNFNGDRKGVQTFMGASVADRAFVGKNVCHTIVYTREHFGRMRKPTCRAGELFAEGMKLYLDQHEEKKFHYPTAAVCRLHPEIGTWVRGRPEKLSGGWTTNVGEGDRILADIDRPQLWEHLDSLT